MNLFTVSVPKNVNKKLISETHNDKKHGVATQSPSHEEQSIAVVGQTKSTCKIWAIFSFFFFHFCGGPENNFRCDK